MTAALRESFISERATTPPGVDESVAIGDFLFLPASSTGGINGSLKGVGGVIALTWSAPTLAEFVATMAQLEQNFRGAWRDAGLPALAQGKTVQRHHA